MMKKAIAIMMAVVVLASLIVLPVSAETLRGLSYTTPMDLQKYKTGTVSSPWEPHTGWSEDNGVLKGDDWIEYCYAVRVPAGGGLFYHPEQIGVKCTYGAGIYSVSDKSANGWADYLRHEETGNDQVNITAQKAETHNGVSFYRIDYTLNGIQRISLYAPSESGDLFSFNYTYKPSTGIAQEYEDDFWDVVNTASLKQKSASTPSAGTDPTPKPAVAPTPAPTAAPTSTPTYRGGKKTTTTDDGLTIVEYLWDDAIKIYVNGERITPDTNPVIVNSRTMVPIRAIAEKLGYSVTWFEDTQTVSMLRETALIQLSIGSDSMYSRGKNIKLDALPFIYENRTYLPVRAVTEAMGCKVEWNAGEQAVYITK